MKLIIALMMLALSASATNAQGYLVTTGPGALIAPPYEGAKHIQLGFLPWLHAGPIGETRRPTVPDDSLGIGLTTGTIGLSIVGALRGERDSIAERTGLNHVSSALELGAAFDYWPRDWMRARVEVKTGVTGHEGWVADLGTDFFTAAGPLTLVAGPRLGFGDKAYMHKYFGITPLEAAANPVISTSFSPKAGLRYYGVATSVVHQHGNWQELAGVTWHRLAGDASKSPAVSQLGAVNQIIVTIGIMYTFGIGN